MRHRHSARNIRYRHEPVKRAGFHQPDIGHAQGILENIENFTFRHGPAAGEIDNPLHARINGIAKPKNIPQHNFGHIGHRRIVKIQRIAITIRHGAAYNRRIAGNRFFSRSRRTAKAKKAERLAGRRGCGRTRDRTGRSGGKVNGRNIRIHILRLLFFCHVHAGCQHYSHQNRQNAVQQGFCQERARALFFKMTGPHIGSIKSDHKNNFIRLESL